MNRIRFHHLREVPVVGLNQTFRFFWPNGRRRGIGLVILRHEISVAATEQGEPT